MKAILRAIEAPQKELIDPILLKDETMELRKEKVLTRMRAAALDAIVVYADLEHSFNFEYLTGFAPRFEEALLILHADGRCFLLLGNEQLTMAQHSRISNTAFHVAQFSLPDQPLENYRELQEHFANADLCGKTIGVVGWKGLYRIRKDLYDVPYYIIDALTHCQTTLTNATDLFIGEHGARTTNGPDEIRLYEYGQVLASTNVHTAMDALEPGKTEIEVASLMNAQGQRHSVVTTFASGPRFVKANLYPTNKVMRLGEPLSITVGYKGGLVNRCGYLVEDATQLDASVADYLEKMAAPYFVCVANWLENIHVGMKGKELYALVDRCLPKERYHWTLNPGHLCADEEWMASPIRLDSEEVLQSGMLFQIDIIPSLPGYARSNCENGIVLADEKLRAQIQQEEPQMWQRFVRRRQYIENVLHIKLHADVMPLSNTVGYLRPYLLNKEMAFCIAA